MCNALTVSLLHTTVCTPNALLLGVCFICLLTDRGTQETTTTTAATMLNTELAPPLSFYELLWDIHPGMVFLEIVNIHRQQDNCQLLSR